MKRFQSLLLLLLAPVLVIGCADDGPEAEEALLKFVHASPDVGAVDVWFNGEELALNRNFIGEGGVVTTYLTVDAVQGDVVVTRPGSGDTVLSESASLDPNSNYTFFLTDTINNFQGVLWEDNFGSIPSDSVLYRIFYAVPGGPDEITVAFEQSGLGPLYENVSLYEDTQFFQTTAPALRTIRVMDSDSAVGSGGGGGGGITSAFVRKVGVNLEAGKAYTFAIVGRAANPSIVVIVHN